MSRKPEIARGRPRVNKPGFTYRLKDIPKADWISFRARARRRKTTLRALLLLLIREEAQGKERSHEQTLLQ